MCILIHKPQGVKMPTNDQLEICFENNPHGAGIGWIDHDGLSHIRKGFMDVKSLKDFIQKNGRMLDSVDVVLHFRYATHGSIRVGNCHPFPVDVKLVNLRNTNYTGYFRIMAHNGVISEFNKFTGGKTDLSDTICLAKLIHEDGDDAAYIKDILTKGHNKFVISDGNGVMKRFGQFIEDGGIFWSNSTYKPYTYKQWSSYQSYDYYRKDDEDDSKWWITTMIVPEIDLDDAGKCIHEHECRKNHECEISGFTIPEMAKYDEYVSICPFYGWKEEVETTIDKHYFC